MSNYEYIMDVWLPTRYVKKFSKRGKLFIIWIFFRPGKVQRLCRLESFNSWTHLPCFAAFMNGCSTRFNLAYQCSKYPPAGGACISLKGEWLKSFWLAYTLMGLMASVVAFILKCEWGLLAVFFISENKYKAHHTRCNSEQAYTLVKVSFLC